MKFTQYLMPNGEQVDISIQRSEEIESLADYVNIKGGSFEIEILAVSPGMPDTSITCNYREEDIAIEVVVNGPSIFSGIDSVVRAAHRIIVEESAPEFR